MFSGCHRDECQPGIIWNLINDVGANSVLMKFWDELRLAGSENMTKTMVIVWDYLKQIESWQEVKTFNI